MQPVFTETGLYGEKGVFVLNTEIKQYTFTGVSRFQQANISCYKDVLNFDGSITRYSENRFSLLYYIRNLAKVLFGEEPEIIEGDTIDYKSIKCVVVDAMSQVQDMIFDYSDDFLNKANEQGKKDKRNTYQEYSFEFKDFIRKLKILPIPMVFITHAMDSSSNEGYKELVAYAVSKKTVGLVEQQFPIVLFTSIDKNKVINNDPDMYRFALRADIEKMPKIPYELYPPEVKFITNDLSSFMLDIYKMYGFASPELAKDFIFPKILIIGHSGSGKSFSIRNL